MNSQDQFITHVYYELCRGKKLKILPKKEQKKDGNVET